MRAGGLLAVAAVIAWAWAGTEFDLAKLADGLPRIAAFFDRMVPPDITIAHTVFVATLETLQIAILGTALGAVASLALGLAAASNLTPAQAIELASAALGQTRSSSGVATTPQPASPLSPEPPDQPARPSRVAGWVAKSSHSFDSRFQRTGPATSEGQDIATSTIPSRFAPAALDGQSLRAEIGRAESADDLRRAMNGPVDRQNVSRFASYSAKRDVTDPI